MLKPAHPAFVWLVGLVIAVSGTAGYRVTESVLHSHAAEDAARTSYHVALDQLTSRRGEAQHRITVAEDALATAQKTLDASNGKTLDESTRTALADTIRQDTQLIGVAKAEQKLISTGAAHRQPRPGFWGPQFLPATERTNAVTFVSASHLLPIPVALTAAVGHVNDAVAAYNAEQARLAAIKAAEEAAARAAAEPYVEHVWTTGWMAQIDACNGAVDVTAHVENVPLIAEHNYCGGRSFPLDRGKLIKITGVDAGLYRSEGVVAHLNGYVDDASDLPRGYDLLYQTCVTGYSNMLYVGLTRVG